MANADPQYKFHALDNVKIWDIANHTRDEESSIAWCQQYGLIHHTPQCSRCHVEMPTRPNYKRRGYYNYNL